MRKNDTPEKKAAMEIRKLCKDILHEVNHWQNIAENGCSDPFWPDGGNMNLTRNHVIYDKRLIREICDQIHLDLPEEYFISTPPEVSDAYMATMKAVDELHMRRIERLKNQYGEQLTGRRPAYNEAERTLF